MMHLLVNLDKLEEAFANICKTIELADSHDLRHEWLP
jgi:hypothetical protein